MSPYKLRAPSRMLCCEVREGNGSGKQVRDRHQLSDVFAMSTPNENAES